VSAAAAAAAASQRRKLVKSGATVVSVRFHTRTRAEVSASQSQKAKKRNTKAPEHKRKTDRQLDRPPHTYSYTFFCECCVASAPAVVPPEKDLSIDRPFGLTHGFWERRRATSNEDPARILANSTFQL